MNSTKALTQLGFVTARGLDNGEQGALLLSNKVTGEGGKGNTILQSLVLSQTVEQIHDMEEKRRSNLKLAGKDEKKKIFKSPDQLERERQDARWSTGKVRLVTSSQ